MLRQILENVALDFTDVTIRIDHLPISHHLALPLREFRSFHHEEREEHEVPNILSETFVSFVNFVVT
jgi:hypothetical protein